MSTSPLFLLIAVFNEDAQLFRTKVRRTVPLITTRSLQSDIQCPRNLKPAKLNGSGSQTKVLMKTVNFVCTICILAPDARASRELHWPFTGNCTFSCIRASRRARDACKALTGRVSHRARLRHSASREILSNRQPSG